MNNIFKNAPKVKDKNTASVILISLLVFVSSTLMLLPVIVSLKSGFTQGNDSPVYLILKGLFAVSLIFCTVVFIVNKNIFVTVIPSITGVIMLIFPLINSIGSYINAKSRAESFGMTVSYEPYIIAICEYSMFLLLCLFTALYSLGYFRLPVVTLIISVVSSILSIYTVIYNYFILLVPIYDTVCFIPACTAPLIPIFLITSTVTVKSKSNKYQPKRMKR